MKAQQDAEEGKTFANSRAGQAIQAEAVQQAWDASMKLSEAARAQQQAAQQQAAARSAKCASDAKARGLQGMVLKGFVSSCLKSVPAAWSGH